MPSGSRGASRTSVAGLQQQFHSLPRAPLRDRARRSPRASAFGSAGRSSGSRPLAKLEKALDQGRGLFEVALQNLPAVGDPAGISTAQAGVHHVHAAFQPHQQVLDGVGQSGHRLTDRAQPLGFQLFLLQLFDLAQVLHEGGAAEPSFRGSSDSTAENRTGTSSPPRPRVAWLRAD